MFELETEFDKDFLIHSIIAGALLFAMFVMASYAYGGIISGIIAVAVAIVTSVGVWALRNALWD